MTTTAEELAHEHVGYEVIAHRRTATACEEAAAVGVPADEVAKTVILVSDDGFVRAVVLASQKVDLDAVRDLLDDPRTRLATEVEVTYGYPLFELGSVPPFGGPGGDRTIVDPHVLAKGPVVFESGSQRESVRMEATDLVELSNARVAPICR
jgi:Ala-tRNA(Pro) deacylase